MDVAKASGISVRCLKDGTPVIAIHLANMSIKVDIFPSQCKIAKIKPLFRIKTEAKNYRHISLLPLISKVTEKSTHNQMQGYIQRNEEP